MIITKRLNIDNGLQGLMKEHQAVTSCIKHLVDNSNFKLVTSNKLSKCLIGKFSEMQNVSYT